MCRTVLRVGALAQNDSLVPPFGACLEPCGCQELSLGGGKWRDGARGMEKRRGEVGVHGSSWTRLLPCRGPGGAW